MPLPVAEEGIAGLLQRSENRRNSVSPNDSPGTARRVGESEEQRKPERFSGHRKAVETDRERPTLDNCICAEVELSSRLQVTAPRIVQGERSAEE